MLPAIDANAACFAENYAMPTAAAVKGVRISHPTAGGFGIKKLTTD